MQPGINLWKAAGATAAAWAFSLGHAADAPYPARNVVIVVPFAAGGSADILTRGVAKGLNEMWGRSIIVENRPGAASMIGAEHVANSEPDGYRLLHATSSYPGAVATRLKLPFDPVTAFVPVAMIARAPFVLAVHPSVPAKTVKEFIALARQRSLTYASSGAGGSNHFAMELLGQMAGFKMIHVPYKGIAPAVVGLIGGDVDVTIASSPGVMTQVKAGRARGIAVSSAERTPLIPGLPTIAESGVPGYAYENWWGLFAPAKTPAGIVSTINASVNKVLVGAEMQQLLAREGAAATPMSVAQLADLLPKEIALYRKMAQAAGMKPE
ncbi:MAG TPA: tripartite tricarboxylate transporter substrate binding protein [Burkholderiales bacterium]|nr:tripartite tricarboxylate transporter substrate binding protein [Burkholderiales bacterium]